MMALATCGSRPCNSLAATPAFHRHRVGHRPGHAGLGPDGAAAPWSRPAETSPGTGTGRRIPWPDSGGV